VVKVSGGCAIIRLDPSIRLSEYHLTRELISWERAFPGVERSPCPGPEASVGRELRLRLGRTPIPTKTEINPLDLVIEGLWDEKEPKRLPARSFTLNRFIMLTFALVTLSQEKISTRGLPYALSPLRPVSISKSHLQQTPHTAAAKGLFLISSLARNFL